MVFINGWVKQYKGYHRNVKLAQASNILSQIGMGIFLVIYNFYVRELGYNEEVNGQVIALTSLATAIVLIPAGIISDRTSRKQVMIVGSFMAAVSLLFRGIFEMENLLLLFAFLTGGVMAFFQVSVVPWLAENSTPQERVHLFSFHFAVMTASNVIGNLIGGGLTDFLSLFMSELLAIRWTLLLGSILFFVSVIPLFLLKETAKIRKNKSEKRIPTVQNWKEKKNSLILIAIFAFSQLLIGFGAGLVIPYLNLYFADRFQASPSIVGLIISGGQAATAIAMFIGPAVVKRVGEVNAVFYLQLLSLPFLLITAYTQHLWVAGVAFLFRQALMNAGNPIQASLVMGKVDNEMKGLANSVNQMVFNLGWAVMGPVSTGIVIQYGAYWGYAAVFSITAVLYVIGSFYFFFMLRSSFFERLANSQKVEVSNTAG
ncbi:predicted MFS family arabinose efflux permease [Bacillus oleivorans]|uniref:Predicted MFS family arabinose efflux permease n=1 Tax=Bacillus oleivorans TaxID=1448271 RepID=A0A285CXL5_9BACI|nr:MFS transporter [Bacillus oleivorans]SNX72327.1 predicted MFS family arabinose efflux permease [Bacillus oleivorans]